MNTSDRVNISKEKIVYLYLYMRDYVGVGLDSMLVMSMSYFQKYPKMLYREPGSFGISVIIDTRGLFWKGWP